MKIGHTKYFYLIGYIITILSCIFYNTKFPLGYDELHAYNIAQNLSFSEIFTITKTEGHPFLWYYILIPFAKTNFCFPYALIILNLGIILFSLHLLYKYAPFPPYLKLLITLSAPFLQLYAYFIRSYSLTILLTFALLSMYSKRHTNQISYLTLCYLLANTNFIGIIISANLMFFILLENIKTAKQNIKPLLHTICYGILNLYFLIFQFYGFNKDIPANTPYNTPSYKNFITIFNQTFSPANTYFAISIILLILFLFIKYRAYKAIFFLTSTTISLCILFIFFYRGSPYHYNFFYIFSICAYWIALQTTNQKIKIFPLVLTAFILIFNTNNQTYSRGATILTVPIKQSAEVLNANFKNHNPQMVIIDPFVGTLLMPYLDKNITLLNQTMTDFRSLKGFQEVIYFFYQPIDVKIIADYVSNTPKKVWLYRSCGEQMYYNTNLIFNLQHHINNEYCLYEIKVGNR